MSPVLPFCTSVIHTLIFIATWKTTCLAGGDALMALPSEIKQRNNG
jgi:hypothetical protein